MSCDDVEYDERLGPILDELLVLARNNKQPDLKDYQRRYPELAQKISELYETIFLIEGNRSVAGDGIAATMGRPNQLQRLGEYRIVQEIGRGGMGIVYEARQESLDRTVAIKVLPNSKVMSDDQVKRFQREARAAGQLRHPNIVGVIDVAEENGLHFYVMQFIKGIPLDRLLKIIRSSSVQQSRLPTELTSNQAHAATPGGQKHRPPEFDESEDSVWSSTRSGSSQYDSKTRYFRSIARLGKDTASALGFAHQHGVLHRDIKPANLLIDDNENIWITDFGLAKYGDDDLTRTGDLVGTLRYMPPERLHGWSDPRGDIYSLGLTIYELATLQPAFESEDRVEILKKIQSEQPIAPRKLNPEIPTDLETIILKSIAKEPSRRYQSADQMAEDLERFLDGRPILARRSTVQKKLWLWCRRQPVIASLLALITLLLVSASISSTIFALKLNENLTRAKLAEQNEKDARHLSTERLYDTYLAQIDASRSSIRPGRRFGALKAISNANELLPHLDRDQMVLRDHAIALMTMVDIEIEKQWVDKNRVSSLHRWGFDGENKLMGRRNSETKKIEIVSVETNKVVTEFPEKWQPDKDSLIDFPKVDLSANAKFLGVHGVHSTGANRTQLWRIDPMVKLVDQAVTGFNDFCFSDDSTRLAFADQRSVYIVDCSTGQELKRLSLGQNAMDESSLAFSSNNAFLAVSFGWSYSVFDVATGKLIANKPSKLWIARIAFDDSTNKVALAGSRNVVITKFGHLDDAPMVLEGHTSKSRKVEFFASQPFLMSTGWDLSTRFWDVNSGDELLQYRLQCSNISNQNHTIGFSRLGQSFGRCRFESARECLILRSNHTKSVAIIDVCFSPDETYLLSTSAHSPPDVQLWSIESGQLLADYAPNESCRCAKFHPSEDRVIVTSGTNSVDKWRLAKELDDFGFATYEFEHVEKMAAGGDRTDFCFNQDGSLYVHGEYPNEGHFHVRKWNSNETIATIDEGPSFWFVALSGDEQFVAVSGKHNQVVVRRIEQMERVFTKTFSENGNRVAFSPDGKLFVICSVRHFEIYQTKNFDLIATIKRESPGIGNACFSKDMKYLALSDLDHVALYDASTLVRLAKLETAIPQQITTGYPIAAGGLSFSPSGRYLAVGTHNSSIQLWNLDLIQENLNQLGLGWSPR